ncbi:dipeptidase, partial [bacterium]|nr:dipeptidase [bacterium]
GDIRGVQAGIEGRYLDLQPAVEATAASLMKTDPDLAAAYLNDYALTHAEDVVVKWRELGEYLLTRYNDGYVKDENGRPRERGYPEAWLRKVLQQRPEQFRLPQTSERTAEPTDY